jgi:succinate dehydrogenase / fumarate reductase flavoprotein subunit
VPRAKGDTRPPREIPEAERYYFLEEKYPRFRNLVPRDIGSREIHDICVNQGMGVGGGLMVYLDLTHVPRAELDRKLGGILEIYEVFVGEDPRELPMKIFPAVHYSMGGIWVGYEATPSGIPDPKSPKNHMTNVPGLFAVGECEYQYHGANRLGANALLSCIYAGKIGGLAATLWARGQKSRAAEQPSSTFDDAKRRWTDRFASIARMQGTESPYDLHTELGHLMTREVTIVRENARLRKTLESVRGMKERYKGVRLDDTGGWANYPLAFVNQLWNMLVLAEIVTMGALARDESRGAHYKPEFPKRDDATWLKSTIARHTPAGPVLEYEPVDVSLIPPVERHYD